MFDQIVINGVGSHDEYGASVAFRTITQGKKKSVKENVPFSNTTYDFSAIDGEIYWEEQTLEYELEIIESSAEDLERRKTELKGWLMNVAEAELHDPFIPDYHFTATFDGIKITDDDGMEKTVVTVTFTAYPYKIANTPTVHAFIVPAYGTVTHAVTNLSNHRIAPVITASTSIVLKMNDVSYGVPKGETQDESFKLPQGRATITFTNSNEEDCTVSLRYYDEVF